MRNGSCWADVAGAPIQVHGGWILPTGDGGANVSGGATEYLWYGEDYVRGGFACYRSLDLVRWHDCGCVLPAGVAPVMERPRVLRCPATGRFVMWFHADDATYGLAQAGVAVADAPEGPFELLRTMRPCGQESRDLTLWADGSGAAWLVHSSEANQTLHVARLTSDYLDVEGSWERVLVDQAREAPCVLAAHGQLYLLTSGCSGWRPNAALFATASGVMGPWKLVDNPCRGPREHVTFGGQATCAFEAAGKPYALLDHWRPDALAASGYSILPVSFAAQKHDPMEICWSDEFAGL